MSDGTAPDPLPAGVGKTALGVAMVRAEESRRGDRLFDDPYAEAFLTAAPGAFEPERQAASKVGADGSRDAAAEGGGDRSGMSAWGAAFWSHAVLRTRFFDDELLAAAARGIRQVVLLAAGLDSRAYRLPWPEGSRIYEVDLPEVLDFKRRALDGVAAVPRCERHAIAADLRGDWAVPLVAAGFRPDQRAVWLLAAHGWRPALMSWSDLAARYARAARASSAGGLLTAVRE